MSRQGFDVVFSLISINDFCVKTVIPIFIPVVQELLVKATPYTWLLGYIQHMSLFDYHLTQKSVYLLQQV